MFLKKWHVALMYTQVRFKGSCKRCLSCFYMHRIKVTDVKWNCYVCGDETAEGSETIKRKSSNSLSHDFVLCPQVIPRARWIEIEQVVHCYLNNQTRALTKINVWFLCVFLPSEVPLMVSTAVCVTLNSETETIKWSQGSWSLILSNQLIKHNCAWDALQRTCTSPGEQWHCLSCAFCSVSLRFVCSAIACS